VGSQLRLIRVLKPFKIARLMKLGKSSAVITILMDYYEISPKQGKTLQVCQYGVPVWCVRQSVAARVRVSV
jgi:hypothetical protein